jgi:hypothetical protein
MMTKETQRTDEITELTQDQLAEVAGGTMKAGPAPSHPDPVIYGYPDGPFGY